jgi:pimeloyl-ACP methyl ester carboxylesterase
MTPKNRKPTIWIKTAFLVVVSVTVGLPLAGFGLERIARWRAASASPPPGELYLVNDRNMHINCTGSGSPTVILEAGLGIWSSAQWFDVQPAVAEFSKVCSYDRAGILWSEPSPARRSAVGMSDELHKLLQAAGVEPPYVLAAHSIGGVLARMFQSQYPNEVAGLVLIDASHPGQAERFGENRSGVPFRQRFRRFLSEIGVTRVILARDDGPPFIPQRVVDSVRPHVPQSFAAINSEMAAAQTITDESQRISTSAGSLNMLPVVVLTRGESPTQEFQATWLSLQEELAALSNNSAHRVVPNAGHNIHLDDPDAVIAAIRAVVTAASDGGRVTLR